MTRLRGLRLFPFRRFYPLTPATHPKGGGGGSFLFRTYQAAPERIELVGEVLRQSEPITLSLIRSRATMAYESESELLSVVNCKLLKSLPLYSTVSRHGV